MAGRESFELSVEVLQTYEFKTFMVKRDCLQWSFQSSLHRKLCTIQSQMERLRRSLLPIEMSFPTLRAKPSFRQ